MSDLKPTRKGLECPLCHKTNGNCRISSYNKDSVFCMTYADGSYSGNDYRFIQTTKNGLWGIYCLLSVNSESYQQYLSAIELAQFNQPLSLAEIDLNLRILFDSLKLSQEHQEDLLRRGLTEQQIADNKYCSITGYHVLPDNIATNLVGVYIGYHGQVNIGSANANILVCPIRQGDKYIGYQRRYNREEKKYTWAKTYEKKDKSGLIIRPQISSKLPNGELPLAYYGEQFALIIYLCDSVSLKPYIAHCKHHINIAGSGGLGFFTSNHAEQLLAIIKYSERIIYCPDAGDIHNRNFWNALAKLGEFINSNYPEKTLEIAWWGQENKQLHQDIDELANLDQVQYLEYRQFLSEYKQGKIESEVTVTEVKKRSQTQMITELIEKYFNNNLSYNDLTGDIEFDGNVIADDLDNLYIDLGLEYNLDLNKNKVYDCAVNLAKKNHYHPIKNYLESLDFPEPLSDNFAQVFFNIDDESYGILISKWLVGAVARIYQAGCQVDNMLVLKGKQGIGKSSFFRSLFGNDWFTDNLSPNLNRDDLMTLHRHWCCEMDELDRITNKKEAGAIKAFISKQRDDFRKPYGKSIISYPRSFVLGGTCNKSEFLVDETGSRRFWVIPVEFVNIEAVERLKDHIWYTAKYHYQNGFRWWLNQEENYLVQEINKAYEIEDLWEKTITEGLGDPLPDEVTANWLAEQVLGLEKKDQTRANQMRIANILKQLGYERKTKWVNGKAKKIWAIG